MTNHPPIPDEAQSALTDAIFSAKHPLYADRVRAFLVAVAPILWGEWTRGMAVVPLPKPDDVLAFGGVDDGHHWEAGNVLIWVRPDGVIQISDVLSDVTRSLEPDGARELGSAILAAADCADRAEQLAAEAVNTDA